MVMIRLSWVIRAAISSRGFRFVPAVSRTPSVIRGCVRLPRVRVHRPDLFSRTSKKSMTNSRQPLSFSLSLLSSPIGAIGNPPAVSYLIHMRGPYACDRVADSEHGPRVPVPIQVASSASRRIHRSPPTSSSSSRVAYPRAWNFVPYIPLGTRWDTTVHLSSPECSGICSSSRRSLEFINPYARLDEFSLLRRSYYFPSFWSIYAPP